LTRVGKNGANGVRHREGVLDLQAGLPTGGLCRIIPDTNLDQRPIPQPSGPRGSFGIRHSPACGIAAEVMGRNAGDARSLRVWLEQLPDHFFRHPIAQHPVPAADRAQDVALD
jgi:hypothetical protein